METWRRPVEFDQCESADAFLPLIRGVSGVQNLTLHSAAVNCSWTDEELLQYPYGRLEDCIVSPPTGHEVELMRSRWQAFVKESLLPYRITNNAPFWGRGIVVVGGHPQSLKRVRVLVRALRNLGSTLPVELHHWAGEMNATTKLGLIEELGANFTINDLSGPHNLYYSRVQYNEMSRINYQLKIAALLNSRFAEPLLLDSDNVPAPAADPAALWDSATYREYGTVVWPDIQRAHRENPYELESGQLLVDKRRFWYHLQLADWFLAQPSLFGRYLLGDKDTFRFAWGALRTQYGRPRKWVALVGTMLPRPRSETDRTPVERFCGHSFAQHHPDTGAVAFVHGGALKSYGGPLLQRLRITDKGKVENLVYKYYKRSGVDEDWGRVEHAVRVAWLNASYMYEVLPGPDPEPLGANRTEMPVYCVDFENQPARDVEEILPGFAAAFEKAGGLWMVGDRYRAGVSGA
ncbi:hypothetical protein PG985_007401 [Apiospora marii]|uniref:Uncharacterized protein n=1 Tax=Apiospora marii TaxID=335849 RepID=A0ABR1SNN8_9PEZI